MGTPDRISEYIINIILYSSRREIKNYMPRVLALGTLTQNRRAFLFFLVFLTEIRSKIFLSLAFCLKNELIVK